MIYLAAPIHKDEDAKASEKLLFHLRELGYHVWAPQEAGLATEVARRTGRDLEEVRCEFMSKDLAAMKMSNLCIAFLGRDREPSQGMLWEMGYMSACNKPVILYNPCNCKFTLMAQFTVDAIVHTFDELVAYLESIGGDA